MATLQQRLTDLATAMATQVKLVKTMINGNVANLTGLKTTAKNNLVAAINELSDGKQASLGFTPENPANKGAANGYAGLDGGGKVPAAQLPSYVDDVLEFANFAAFPNPGESGKVYIAADTDREYRWSGTAYRQIVASPGTTDAVPEGVTNLYFTSQRAQDALAAQLGNTDLDLVAVFNSGLN
jgi:hypothetical protein